MKGHGGINTRPSLIALKEAMFLKKALNDGNGTFSELRTKGSNGLATQGTASSRKTTTTRREPVGTGASMPNGEPSGPDMRCNAPSLMAVYVLPLRLVKTHPSG